MSRKGVNLNAWLSDEEDKKLKEISQELLGKVNKTQAVIILIKQYRLNNG